MDIGNLSTCDLAHDACTKDAQSRLLDKESEIGKLRDLLSQALTQKSAVATTRGGGPRGAAAGRAAGSSSEQQSAQSGGVLIGEQQRPQPLHSRRGASLAAVAVPGAGGGAGGQGVHESMESLPIDLSQIHSLGLPSPPSTLMLPEAAPSPLWRGGGRGGVRGGGARGSDAVAAGSPSWLGAGRPTNAAAAAAAAARAEMYLRASREDLDELLRYW